MTLTIEYETDKKLQLPCESIIRTVVAGALRYMKIPYEIELNVLLTDNEGIREMNREYRNIDSATDVLSFPMLEYEAPADFSRVEEKKEEYFNPETGELVFGDIVISVEKVIEQAMSYQHTEERELAFLIAHSMFHLMGFDHMEEPEAAVMEQKQRELLKILNFNR